MIQTYELPKIMNDVLTPSLRIQNVVELLYSYCFHAIGRNSEFNDKQFNLWLNYSVIPQVSLIEFLLNLTVTGVTGSIFIIDGDVNIDPFMFKDYEYNPEELYIFKESENAVPEFYCYKENEIEYKSFYVQIPVAYINDTDLKAEIASIVNRLRPYGTTWDWLTY